MSARTTVIRCAAGIGMVIVAAAGCRGEGASTRDVADRPPSDSLIALPVVGAVVRRADLVLSIRTTGQVRAERQAVVRIETPGTVASVSIRPGDHVAAGATLMQLDTRPLDLAVREARASLADAQVRFEDLLIGVPATDSSEPAQRRRATSRLRAGLDGAEARLERAELERSRATIRAPFEGTVDAVSIVAGQSVSASDPAVMLVDLGSLFVEAAVLEHDLPHIRVGASASVSAAAGGPAVRGRVTAVLPIVDTASHAGRVLVALGTVNGQLRPGMYADVELEASRLPGRVLVPASAVIERDGRPLVFRARNARAEWVYVTAGRSNGRETEILPDSTTGRPAVAPGDTVLVSGHLTLTHDAPIKL